MDGEKRDNMCDCKTCKIRKKAIKEGGCCVWYMDNVVIAGKSVKECPKYKLKTK